MTRRRGFTLIELLVVIAIIAILVAMLLPAVQAVREAARKAQCQDHLHNIGIALHNYEGSFKVFPYSVSHSGSATAGTAANRAIVLNHRGWLGVLPFLEQKPLYDQLDLSLATGAYVRSGHAGALPRGLKPGDTGNDNDLAVNQSLDIFLCPSDPGPTHITSAGWAEYSIAPGSTTELGALTNYDFSSRRTSSTMTAWNQDTFETRPLFGVDACAKMADIVDGSSNVVMVCETTRDVHDGKGQTWGYSKWVGNGVGLDYSRGINDLVCCAWDAIPNSRPRSPARLGSWSAPGSVHPGGCQVVLGDDKVAFLSENIDANTRLRLFRISDNLPLGQY